jgi:hypothetical protein
MLPVALRATLAVIAATHAPTSILPSSAMFSIPLRSDRMPASAPSVSGVASSKLPLRTRVRFAVVPLSSAPRMTATYGTRRTRSHGRHRNGAPRHSWRAPTSAAASPAMTHSRPTLVATSNASGPVV